MFNSLRAMTVNLMREDPAIRYGAPLLGSRCQAGQLRCATRFFPAALGTFVSFFEGILWRGLQRVWSSVDFY